LVSNIYATAQTNDKYVVGSNVTFVGVNDGDNVGSFTGDTVGDLIGDVVGDLLGDLLGDTDDGGGTSGPDGTVK